MSGNNGNLKVLTSEEARIYGKKGGIASGVARRRRKTMKQDLLFLLELVDKEGISNQENILFSQILQAKRGNTKAAEFIRDTVGERPKESLALSGVVESPVTALSEEDLREIAKQGREAREEQNKTE